MKRPFASRLRQCAFLRWLVAVVVSHGGALPAHAAEDRPANDRPASREATPSTGLTTIGHVETVELRPVNIHIDAKIDTGARSSSLDAGNIQPFSKDGKEWVRFTLRGNDSVPRRIELPVERTVRIKRAGAPVQRRYVVSIGVCLGNYYKMAEVNLINREGLGYRMLIGRSFLAGKFVIDPGAQNLTRPACPDR